MPHDACAETSGVALLAPLVVSAFAVPHEVQVFRHSCITAPQCPSLGRVRLVALKLRYYLWLIWHDLLYKLYVYRTLAFSASPRYSVLRRRIVPGVGKVVSLSTTEELVSLSVDLALTADDEQDRARGRCQGGHDHQW